MSFPSNLDNNELIKRSSAVVSRKTMYPRSYSRQIVEENSVFDQLITPRDVIQSSSSQQSKPKNLIYPQIIIETS